MDPGSAGAAAVRGGDVPGGASDGSFVAAATFQGSKEGFVFKNGERGLGYYKDERAGRPTESAVMAPSASSNGDEADRSEAAVEAAEEEEDAAQAPMTTQGGLMESGQKMKEIPRLAFTNTVAFDLD